MYEWTKVSEFGTARNLQRPSRCVHIASVNGLSPAQAGKGIYARWVKSQHQRVAPVGTQETEDGPGGAASLHSQLSRSVTRLVTAKCQAHRVCELGARFLLHEYWGHVSSITVPCFTLAISEGRELLLFLPPVLLPRSFLLAESLYSHAALAPGHSPRRFDKGHQHKSWKAKGAAPVKGGELKSKAQVSKDRQKKVGFTAAFS